MLDHVSITVADLARSAPFWKAVMAVLGVPCVEQREGQLGYGTRNRPGDDGYTYLSICVSTSGSFAVAFGILMLWSVGFDGSGAVCRLPSRRADGSARHRIGAAAAGVCRSRQTASAAHSRPAP